MDTAVALVKSYLQANGFFTVTEYPILETIGDGTSRTVTDVDVLALRFPGAGGIGSEAKTGGIRIRPHEALGLSEDNIEVIIAEVKEGAADLNKAARDPDVLAAVLRRFGRMGDDVVDDIARELIDTGAAMHPAGIRLRVMVFGSKPPSRATPHYRWLSLGAVATWLTETVSDNWDQLKTIQAKDPAIGLLVLFEKARRGET